MEKPDHTNHCEAVLRIIDKTLLEEEVVLHALQEQVAWGELADQQAEEAYYSVERGKYPSDSQDDM